MTHLGLLGVGSIRRAIQRKVKRPRDIAPTPSQVSHQRGVDASTSTKRTCSGRCGLRAVSAWYRSGPGRVGADRGRRARFLGGRLRRTRRRRSCERTSLEEPRTMRLAKHLIYTVRTLIRYDLAFVELRFGRLSYVTTTSTCRTSRIM